MTTLKNMRKSGLFAEHTNGFAPWVESGYRLTIPAREALETAGIACALIDPMRQLWSLTIDPRRVRRMPDGLVAVETTDAVDARRRIPAIRLEIEPEFPVEYDDCWLAAQWMPCPRCGAPVVWYEAGHVPGYRVCTRKPHHHSLVVAQ